MRFTGSGCLPLVGLRPLKELADVLPSCVDELE